MKLKKQIAFFDFENNSNNQQQRPKVGTQSMNFGKSIKLKAQMLQEPHPMREQINGVSQVLKTQEPTVRPQMRRAASFDDEDLSFKSKMVRFEDEESEEQSLQYSRNTRKNQSILKKSPSVDKQSINSGTSDMGAIDFFPSKSALKPQGAVSSNDKYEKTVKMLKYENVKFVDNLFPPGAASLCYSKNKMNQFSNVRWMRLEDLFKGKRLVFYSEHAYKKCLIRKGCLDYCDNMVTALNAISNSSRCLQRMLQDQRVFGLCVYFIRINHDGVWKYVVVDDYVPVVRTADGDVPAFLNVQENCEGEIQIWPFLVQKALAKLNNCYECIFQDTPDNLVYEFSGVQCEELDLREDSTEFKFRSSVLHSQAVILASNPIHPLSFPDSTYALRQDCDPTANTYFNLDVRLRIIESTLNRNLCFDLADLRKIFQIVKVFRIQEGNFAQGFIIKQTKGTMSLRKLVVKDRTCSCTLSLVQKDRKYYRNNGYDYVWARLMLMTRDGSNGYRWISGKYQKSRIISLTCLLQPGEYFLLVAGDWKSRAFEMVLNYNGSEEIEITRDTFEQHPRIITQTCVDIAQRFGIFKQINRNICSYRLVDRLNGFIIQNNNNQANRQVFFHKIYSLPVNSPNTYELMERHQYLEEDQNEVQILIEPNSHFTFAVRIIDGFTHVLENFHFE